MQYIKVMIQSRLAEQHTERCREKKQLNEKHLSEEWNVTP